MKFRHSAGFGKRMEYFLVGQMLKEGLDCYMPLVDDDGIDVVIRKEDGTFIEVQIKARSATVVFGNCALFAALKHQPRENYYFVFYSERLDIVWVMSSEEFLKECVTNKNGVNIGKRSICLNGRKGDKEYPLVRFEKYIDKNFDRLKVSQTNDLGETQEEKYSDKYIETLKSEADDIKYKIKKGMQPVFATAKDMFEDLEKDD